jgi:hypothetical protein
MAKGFKIRNIIKAIQQNANHKVVNTFLLFVKTLWCN